MIIECFGGPLNCRHVELPGPAAEVMEYDGGRYRLTDGAYHWHAGPAAAQPASEQPTPDEQVAADAEVEHIRPAPKHPVRRPRTPARKR